MMIKRFASLFLLSLLSLPAQALQVIVWDRDLQTKLGYGETLGSKLNMQLVSDYSGPVVILMARDGNEKTTYTGLQSRYDGLLKNGQLSFKDDNDQTLNLVKLLNNYKISVTFQSASQSISLPGLRNSDPKGKN